MSIYLELTRQFNDGALRAIISSGQAVVLHRLAIMSKDGDWILRETPATMRHVLETLDARAARYRLGAPLDTRWLAAGWSAHLEFAHQGLRVRTDFLTRPPRIGVDDLRALWRELEGAELPVVDLRRLVEIKKTNREKDYAVIGELARGLADPRQQLLASRSARDLLKLAADHPELLSELAPQRPALSAVSQGRGPLEAALDAERRELIHRNERRLLRYAEAAEAWRAAWPEIDRAARARPLLEAHALIVERAERLLPFAPGDAPGA
jgi:hypothetical protein